MDIIITGSKKAAVGIGTLILIIAMLIVAAVAGYVLIFSQNAMEDQSLSTASAARREVTTQVELYDLRATDGTTGELDYFQYSIRLKPGAEAINLRQVILYMNTNNETLRLTYKPGECKRDVADGFFTYR